MKEDFVYQTGGLDTVYSAEAIAAMPPFLKENGLRIVAFTIPRDGEKYISCIYHIGCGLKLCNEVKHCDGAGSRAVVEPLSAISLNANTGTAMLHGSIQGLADPFHKGHFITPAMIYNLPLVVRQLASERIKITGFRPACRGDRYISQSPNNKVIMALFDLPSCEPRFIIEPIDEAQSLPQGHIIRPSDVYTNMDESRMAGVLKNQGYVAVGFRVPVQGESYVAAGGAALIVQAFGTQEEPRLIVQKSLPDQPEGFWS